LEFTATAISNEQQSAARHLSEAQPQSFFKFENVKFAYEPFPIGLVTPIMEEALYDELLNSYPDLSLFKSMPYLGSKESVKYSLAELNNGENYQKFLASTPIWRQFHDWVKSPEFLVKTLKMLAKKNIELGIYDVNLAKKHESAEASVPAHTAAGLKIPLSARFEFSVLPADGGQLHPHTDSPSKIITWVISMVRPGEWDHSFGGSTDIMRPKDTEQNFNWVNRYLEFEEVETLSTYNFNPNQALVFVKTFNSWHAVKPMTGKGSQVLRRTLTINIERTDL
jgi:hypothetical protein